MTLPAEPGFTVEVAQNEYLPAGGQVVHAIVTVTSTAPVEAPQDLAGAEIIIIDTSGSMMRRKIAAAREATWVALNTLRDGVAFAVIAGTDSARMVYPRGGGMALADPQTRQDAINAVAKLRAGGGTAIGQWLRKAHDVFGRQPAGLRHAILLTDGKNSESAREMDRVLELCSGVFSCDCRGVGTNWKVSELRRIATALHGTVDIVAEPEGLAADFAAMMQASMSKQVADVSLRVWTPRHAQLRFVRQVAPAVEDLASWRTEAGPQAGDYATGAWAAGESRDYHVCVAVDPGQVGQEMLAARVSLIANQQVLGQGLVRAIWTQDEALSTRISRPVAHYTGQAELAQAIHDGLEARKRGDQTTATDRLGRAVALASQSGHEDTARLLAGVVDVVDAASGTVRLKQRVSDADEMALDTRSTKTVRTKQ
jgi:hypothetical protein